MRKNIFFRTDNNNRYLYSENLKCSIVVHPLLEHFLKNGDNSLYNYKDCYSNEEINYYRSKYNYLKKVGFSDSSDISFVTKPNPDEIKTKLANLRQLVVEVTDSCNLNCHYCAYGDLYKNYDSRTTGKLIFKKIKNAIDYLISLWNSPYNLSFNNTVDISFYGGEPTLNMRTIKDTISYLSDLNVMNMNFKYRMTTNAILLEKYMDYLVENKFNLLISIDGDKYGNSYRITKKGNNSFEKVYNNILLLKETYPHFYESNVNINAVLHDRNSYKSIFLFIKEKLGKLPLVSELNDGGIRKDKIDEFNTMFKNTYQEQIKFYEEYKEKDQSIFNSSENLQLRSLVHGYTGNMYKSLNDLLKNRNSIFHMPSGTCIAFYKKVFITVNGKIFPCEKIGQNFPLGFVTNENVNIDFDYITSLYDSMYKPLLKLCKQCYHQVNCSQCVFNIYDKSKNGKLYCPTFVNKKAMEDYLRVNFNYIENNPVEYEKQIEVDSLS